MFIGHCHCFNPHLKVVTGLIDAQLQDVYKLFGIDESITSQFNHMASTLQKIKLDWEESFLMRSIAVTFSGKEVSKPAIVNIILPIWCVYHTPPPPPSSSHVNLFCTHLFHILCVVFGNWCWNFLYNIHRIITSVYITYYLLKILSAFCLAKHSIRLVRI